MSELSSGGFENRVPSLFEALGAVCDEREFAPGDVLRQKGQHYRHILLITDGEYEVVTEPGNRQAKPVVRGAGLPVGEIGFLRGLSATADVVAKTPARALVFDDATMLRLGSEQPELVVGLLQWLGQIAEDRTSYNLTLPDGDALDETPADVEILMCRNPEMMQEAQRLRYKVYCGELERQSPSADHENRTISDELDAFAHCFIAVRSGETVGTIRINFSRDGSMGMLEQLYGMNTSACHPTATGITTKFIVMREFRRSPLSMQLVAHATQFGLRHEMKECYIDSIPQLIHYYRAMGFQQAEEVFLHPENGPSMPMRLDLTKYGKNLTGKVGLKRMITLYVKAKAYKLAQGVLG